jgi:hypothetical protein
VLTDVITEQGITGHSYVFCYSTSRSSRWRCWSRLESLVAGQPAAPLDIEQMLSRRFRLLGPAGAHRNRDGRDDSTLGTLARARDRAPARLLGRMINRIRLPRRDRGYDGAGGSARVAASYRARLQGRQGEDRLSRRRRGRRRGARD